MLDSDANTAKTLTLVAIILQVVFFVIGIFAVAALLKYRREILGEGGQSVALIISGGNVSDSLLKSLTE